MSILYIPVLNEGVVTALQGTLSLSGGGTLAGSFTASASATIDFSGGGFTNAGPAAITGPGSVQFTGGSLTLLTENIPNLPLAGGTVWLGPAFQDGAITNLTIDGATHAGTNMVTGVFNWNNGTLAACEPSPAGFDGSGPNVNPPVLFDARGFEHFSTPMVNFYRNWPWVTSSCF